MLFLFAVEEYRTSTGSLDDPFRGLRHHESQFMKTLNLFRHSSHNNILNNSQTTRTSSTFFPSKRR